ncbi:tRNA glutamyl-Q(34) synthetase GluQRS [Aestuariibacter sp. A3R04]|uniref:tRNA glutamyl-Q(34) synthetase GluQRS n=1 Tax=Aestuariibacter sp. A3R04 TaxID=2841571 RepID=UPI002090A448|nr:tRNA glutamyl-Q(34) synthetase GluQRS [Aestuariibacter sp. A3R04]
MIAAPYVGRFAPTPSGPLHFGSLIAALASYLDAKANSGQWLVRMEDIDEPRCMKHADEMILDTLALHGLTWDGDVVYQSRRHQYYQRQLNALLTQHRAYYCNCTRAMIRQHGGVYPGTCRDENRPAEGAAVRIELVNPITSFTDRVLGQVEITDPHALEDTVLKRRDGLFSYNLVVVLDDIDQGVTDIIRGSDLLTTTATHLSLYTMLGKAPPRYGHIPVASVAEGRKLSKQNHAAALNMQTPVRNLCEALAFLNLPLPSSISPRCVDDVLQWATDNWHINKIPQKMEIIVAAEESTYHT